MLPTATIASPANIASDAGDHDVEAGQSDAPPLIKTGIDLSTYCDRNFSTELFRFETSSQHWGARAQQQHRNDKDERMAIKGYTMFNETKNKNTI